MDSFNESQIKPDKKSLSIHKLFTALTPKETETKLLGEKKVGQ